MLEHCIPRIITKLYYKLLNTEYIYKPKQNPTMTKLFK